MKDDDRRVIVPASEMDVRDVVAPLWKLPYGAQLALKWGKVATALAGLGPPPGGGEGAGAAAAAAAWSAALTPVGILRSPATRGYHNKCEFSVGPGVEKDGEGSGAAPPVAVAFCLGAFRDGVIEVGPPGPAPHVSPDRRGGSGRDGGVSRRGRGGRPDAARLGEGRLGRLLAVAHRAGGPHTGGPPMPTAAPGTGPEALLEEGLADQGAACPAFVELPWERWLVPAAALPKDGEGDRAQPVASTPPPPLPPLRRSCWSSR